MLAQFSHNISQTPQVFFDRTGDSIKLLPGEIRDVSTSGKTYAFLQHLPSVIKYILDTGIRAITLSRYSAAGDILMLVPVAKYLEEEYGLDVTIKTFDKFIHVIELFGVKCVGEHTRARGSLISVDGIVEKDHYIREAQAFHRVELYLRALGVTPDLKKIRWDCDLNDFGLPLIEGDYVVFQPTGSHKTLKSLPAETAAYIVEQLVAEFTNVVVIGDKSTLYLKGKKFADDYSLPELVNVIGWAKVLVTMDSLPLWISHFTKTPVVAVLGPTPAANRLTLHPLYPEGVVAIETAKQTNCSPCFEAGVACNRKVTCLAIDKQNLYSQIAAGVRKFVGFSE